MRTDLFASIKKGTARKDNIKVYSLFNLRRK